MTFSKYILYTFSVFHDFIVLSISPNWKYAVQNVMILIFEFSFGFTTFCDCWVHFAQL